MRLYTFVVKSVILLGKNCHAPRSIKVYSCCLLYKKDDKKLPTKNSLQKKTNHK